MNKFNCDNYMTIVKQLSINSCTNVTQRINENSGNFGKHHYIRENERVNQNKVSNDVCKKGDNRGKCLYI